jgi:hypothetical protein
MFTEYDKAIVALIMAILSILALAFNWNLGGHFSEETVAAFIALVTPVLVFFVPNYRSGS